MLAVLAWGVSDADQSKGFLQCGKSRLGRDAVISLSPGGIEMLLLTIEAR